MMPMSELLRMAQTVDDDHRSPVADEVAALWGRPPGEARFWRSSASHVFAVDGAYLRLVPVGWCAFAGIADLMLGLAGREVAVAQPILSLSGKPVETVATGYGELHAMMVAQAPGTPIDDDELTAEVAHEWGRTLAVLHLAAPVEAALPDAFAEMSSLPGAAAEQLRRKLDDLPRDDAYFGLIHGDFELDNMAWEQGRPTCYDFDEAARSWFAADIACATSDLGPEMFGSFLAGYRTVRPMTDRELSWIPLFEAASAACWLARLPSIVDIEPTADDPQWLVRLHQRLAERARLQRELVLNVATSLIT